MSRTAATLDDLRHLHRRALRAAGDVVAVVAPADLGRATPCAGWNLTTLLAHAIGQNHGFAAAVADGDAPLDAYAPRPVEGRSPADDWQESADRLESALAAAPADRPVRLVEVGPDAPLPLPSVLAVHLLDTVVHTWDVASALDRVYRPDDDTVAAVLAVARRIPTPGREPGAAFGPVKPLTGDDWHDALALLGRSAPPGSEPPAT